MKSEEQLAHSLLEAAQAAANDERTFETAAAGLDGLAKSAHAALVKHQSMKRKSTCSDSDGSVSLDKVAKLLVTHSCQQSQVYDCTKVALFKSRRMVS